MFFFFCTPEDPGALAKEDDRYCCPHMVTVRTGIEKAYSSQGIHLLYPNMDAHGVWFLLHSQHLSVLRCG